MHRNPGTLWNSATLRTARNRAELANGRRDWFRLTNLAEENRAELAIYDEIGYFGITASDLVSQLCDLDAPRIDVRINSPGGEIFDGIAIMNALRSHRAKIYVQVDSLAASIASVIAMAGDEIAMVPFSQMMIHDGLGVCIGNAADMRKTAELLDRQSDNLAAIYASRAGGQTRSWRKRMQAETWYSAQEAVDAGLADKIAKPAKSRAQEGEEGGEEEQMAARWDLTIFRYAGRENSPGPYAAQLLNKSSKPDEGDKPDDEEPQDKAASGGKPSKGEEPASKPDDEDDEEGAEEPDEDDEDEDEKKSAPKQKPKATASDDWAALTAHLTTSQNGDEQFARLREGLLT